MTEQGDVPSKKPRKDWDRITAVAAVLIGVVAVVVSVYTAMLQRQQVSAEVWPRLAFYFAGTEGEFRVANKGVGPAIIESVEIAVDGKPARNWNEVMRQLRLDDPGQRYSTLSGYVMSPGEDLPYLLPSSPEQFAAIRAQTDRLDVRVCYCSALHDCWLLESGADQLRELGQCPDVPENRRFED